MRPGEWVERPERLPPTSNEEQKDKKHERKTKSLAETRGHNWGLPDAARGSVGVSRLIRIRCFSDRLDILSESGDMPTQVIPLGQRSDEFIDAMVSAVWDQMKPWGIAGRGMYWRPTLEMSVARGAEARFEELKALLDNSGLDVRKKEP